MTYNEWLKEFNNKPGSQRLGQAFCNDFLGNTVPSQIFNEEEYWRADAMIIGWLVDNCHYPNVPEKIQ